MRGVVSTISMPRAIAIPRNVDHGKRIRLAEEAAQRDAAPHGGGRPACAIPSPPGARGVAGTCGDVLRSDVTGREEGPLPRVPRAVCLTPRWKPPMFEVST